MTTYLGTVFLKTFGKPQNFIFWGLCLLVHLPLPCSQCPLQGVTLGCCPGRLSLLLGRVRACATILHGVLLSGPSLIELNDLLALI